MTLGVPTSVVEDPDRMSVQVRLASNSSPTGDAMADVSLANDPAVGDPRPTLREARQAVYTAGRMLAEARGHVLGPAVRDDLRGARRVHECQRCGRWINLYVGAGTSHDEPDDPLTGHALREPCPVIR